MRIALGSDHAGFDLKRRIADHLSARPGVEVLDLGPADASRVDYPVYAERVGRAVARGEAALGILVCGSGIGISIAANKIAGVRAALCHDDFTARMARAHNDANILCLGARVLGEGTALSAVDAFLGGTFEGGRHADRVAQITALESPSAPTGKA
jgi:ribose 5-phosphate isomerase B